jgi:hypothetical protein
MEYCRLGNAWMDEQRDFQKLLGIQQIELMGVRR